MTTITIPKSLIAEKNLMIVPRSEYEGLLKRLRTTEADEHVWKSAAKDALLKSYGKSDEMYDKI